MYQLVEGQRRRKRGKVEKMETYSSRKPERKSRGAAGSVADVMWTWPIDMGYAFSKRTRSIVI